MNVCTKRRFGLVAIALMGVALVLSLMRLPGTVLADENSNPADVTWNFNPNVSSDLADIAFEGDVGNWQDIHIDATNGKFSPRTDNGDTQVNSGTTLSLSAEESEYGATLTLTGNGAVPGVSCACDGKDIQGKVSGKSISFEIPESGGDINLTFNSQSYLSSMSLTYIVPFPGDPTDVAVKDTTWDLSNLSETDQSFQDKGIQRGEVDGLKIDASGSGAKFAPREGDTQVNPNTIIYVPIAQSFMSRLLSPSMVQPLRFQDRVVRLR